MPQQKGIKRFFTPKDGEKKEEGDDKRKKSEVEEEVGANVDEKEVHGNGSEAGQEAKEEGQDPLPSDPEIDALIEKYPWLAEMDDSWAHILRPEFKKPYFKDILKMLDKEKASKQIVYPPEEEVFNAFKLTPFDQVKVVIIGQDPYHGPNQGHGLCFSVKKGVQIPPSLRNMYKELTTDIPTFKTPPHGFLEEWAKQGVLMLNATLTVRKANANSHAKSGWMTFTDAAISALSKKKEGVVFLLWGGFAQKKSALINSSKHHIIKTAHPSPLSAAKWFGCKTFSKTNKALVGDGKTPIDWSITP